MVLLKSNLCIALLARMYSVIRLYGKMPIQISDIFCARYCHVKGKILTQNGDVAKFFFSEYFYETLIFRGVFNHPQSPILNGNWQCSDWYHRSSWSKFCTNVVESSAQVLSSSHNRGADQRDNVHL